MSIQQSNLNAAFPSPNDNDAVLDETTGRYWRYNSSLGEWEEFSESFNLNYISNFTEVQPYILLERYTLGIKHGIDVELYDYNVAQSLIDNVDLGVNIGGQIQTIEAKILPATVETTVSAPTPNVFSQQTAVQVGNIDVTVIVYEPSLMVSGIRISETFITTTALFPEIRTSVRIEDVTEVEVIPQTTIELDLAPYIETPVISVAAYEPIAVGSFVLAEPTVEISVTEFAPTLPQVSVPAEYIIIYNSLIQGLIEVKTSPKVEDSVQITVTAQQASVVTGNPVFIDDVVTLNITANVPDVDAFPAVWDAAWWGGWTLNWNQLPETFNLNYIGSTTPQQEDIDIACTWNKPYVEDAYKTNAGVTSPNPINSINGRRAEAPTKLYPGRPEQKFSGEFTSSNEGCPRIVFTETINWNHPEKASDVNEIQSGGYDGNSMESGIVPSAFASFADYSDKPWAWWGGGARNTTYDPDLGNQGFPKNRQKALETFRSYNFFHPGGSWHENTPSVTVSRLNNAYGSSHLDVAGVFTLEMWIYPEAANFTGTGPADYIPIMGHNQYWQFDKNHDPYNQKRVDPASPFIGDNFFTGWDLYFYGNPGGPGTVAFRGSSNKYRWIDGEEQFDTSFTSVFQYELDNPSIVNAEDDANNDPLSIFGIDTPQYTSVLHNSANNLNVTVAEEPTYYDHRCVGAANQLIADQWNHIVLHCDGAGYINIAVNGVWGADQRLRCGSNAEDYLEVDDDTENNTNPVTQAYRFSAKRPITNLRFKDYPTQAIQHHMSKMEDQLTADAAGNNGWIYMRETNHTDYSKITLGAFTEPFYTWMDELPQGYGAGKIATDAFTEVIPGIHNRFQGYIHEIRYMPWLKYDPRYYRGSYLADHYYAGDLTNTNTPSPTFVLPGDSGISGLTWPDFSGNLPTEPFPYSFGRREVDGTVSTVCTSVYEPELRRYYWHSFNRVRSITQHYNSWTGIPDEWYRHINEFIISCKKDGNWYKMDDVFIFPGYSGFRGDGFVLKGRTLDDYFTEDEIDFSTPGFDPVVREPGYDRHFGITNSLGGDTPSANLLGLRLARVNSDWPEVNHHRATYVTKVGSGPVFSSGIDEYGSTTCDWYYGRAGIKHGFITNEKIISGEDAAISNGGFIGFNRYSKDFYESILPGQSGLTRHNSASQTPWMEPVELLKTSTGQNYDYKTAAMSNHSLGFYSHGRAVDLQRLSYRVNKLMTELAALRNSWQPEQFYVGNDF